MYSYMKTYFLSKEFEIKCYEDALCITIKHEENGLYGTEHYLIDVLLRHICGRDGRVYQFNIEDHVDEDDGKPIMKLLFETSEDYELARCICKSFWMVADYQLPADYIVPPELL